MICKPEVGVEFRNKVLVIGESCRDVFVYCDAIRLAPDVPVPVLSVIDQVENPGMAKNVWRNIQSLHANCDIVTNTNWYNITKTRYMHKTSNHMFFRVDAPHDIPPCDIDAVDLASYELVVVSDYNKGYLTEDHIDQICRRHQRVFLDTKKPLGKWASHAFIIKINDYEYNHTPTEYQQLLHGKLIHTMGAQGCEYMGQRYKVDPVEVRDTSGAGDSFMAGLVVQFLQSNNMITAVEFANQCASKVVRQRGVTVI